MPHATADDGVRLYYEETGSGIPVIFVHEYAGDHRSWEPQMRHFGQRYRAITFDARGYPPSDVPEEVGALFAARAADDIGAVLDHLGIDQAHVVGLSMGGFATLHFGFRHRGAGALAGGRRAAATAPSRTSATAFAPRPRRSPTSSQPRACRCSPRNTPTARPACSSRTRILAVSPNSSAAGRALGARLARNTQLGVQRERPSLYDLIEQMKALTRADAGADRRRGLAVPGARHPDEAEHPDRGAGGDAELRPRDQPGGPDEFNRIVGISWPRWMPGAGRRATRAR